MGLFDRLFPKRKQRQWVDGYFRTLTAYDPVFSTWSGKLYESELVRASIDAKARHISKLEISIEGAAQPTLQNKMKYAPNEYHTWSQFLYRLSTILDMQNTAFIIPVYDDKMNTIGIETILPSSYELVNVGGNPWIRFRFSTGDNTAEELSRVGVMTKHQYMGDFFGDDNGALSGTMQLIDIQEKGIAEAAKNSSTYRFMARAGNFAKAEDLKKERARFSRNNFQGEDGGGLLLFPNTYADIKELTPRSYSVDADQMQLIQTNVFNYFGVNEKVLQNSAVGDELDAFWNGAIEPFAVQLSDVLTKMLFTQTEISYGARINVTSNRLQYMTTQAKVSMAQQLGDRGALLIDEIRELFNYPPLPDGAGQHAPIRGEYQAVDQKLTGNEGDQDNGE